MAKFVKAAASAAVLLSTVSAAATRRNLVQVQDNVVDGSFVVNGIDASMDDVAVYQVLENAISETLGAEQVIFSLEAETCGQPPLCGTSDMVFTLNNDNPFPFYNVSQSEGELITMETCCNKKELRDYSGRECHEEYRSTAKQCRTQQANIPFCDPEVFSGNCDALVGGGDLDLLPAKMTLHLNFVVEEAEDYCCKTCTCYGDPHCISFDGGYDNWLLCDARDPVTCKVKKDICESLRDPTGATCEWLPTPGEHWEFWRYGSQCQSNPASAAPWMLMYQYNFFKVDLEQGERGVIQKVNVTLSTDITYQLDAEDCFSYGDHAWNVNGEPTSVPAGWESYHEYGDLVWVVEDATTGIAMKLRCIRNEGRNGQYGYARINVDRLTQPNEDLDQDSGFCAAGVINDKIGDTNMTDLINLREDKCRNNLLKDVEIARQICGAGIGFGAIDQCKLEFCNEYSHIYYPTVEHCINSLNNNWALGFCRTFAHTRTDRIKCLDYISDNGWSAAVQKYLNEYENSLKECVPEINFSLKKSLTECQRGVTLQYQDPETNEWVDHTAIPISERLCANKLEFFADTPANLPLFVNPVRLSQCNVPEGRCVKDGACQAEFSYFGKVEFERDTRGIFQTLPTGSPTMRPSKMPTITTERPSLVPTRSPTNSPSASPTRSPTRSPTVWPTTSPSAAPSTLPPTSAPTSWPTASPSVWPTDAPSKYPTESPTKYPTTSPTSAPTESPTKYPTTSPTSAPTESPTKYPTTSPTSAPTESPTKYPTTSPTGVPTESPTKYPTTSPTSAPTESPTKYPTTSPTGVPTESPTKYPTTSPTSAPTESPTKYPTTSPTGVPTESPTKYPTTSPTSAPSETPTKYPTTSPTGVPTESPTKYPTTSPTSAPTESPTKYPTTSPTGSPTKYPTYAPSAAPTPWPKRTHSPSSAPSSSPSASPSVSPSSSPTITPTAKPTSSPNPDCVDFVDIIFVVDSSESIGEEDFQKVREYMNTLAASFTISPSDSRLSMVSFSTGVVVEFSLGSPESTSLGDFTSYTSSLPFLNGVTCTAGGLLSALNNIVPDRRENVKTVAVLITDGLPNKFPQDGDTCADSASCTKCSGGSGLGGIHPDAQAEASAAAALLRAEDVSLISIGVGNNIQETFLESLSDNYVTVTDFDELSEVVNIVRELTLCVELFETPTSSPSAHPEQWPTPMRQSRLLNTADIVDDLEMMPMEVSPTGDYVVYDDSKRAYRAHFIVAVASDEDAGAIAGASQEEKLAAIQDALEQASAGGEGTMISSNSSKVVVSQSLEVKDFELKKSDRVTVVSFDTEYKDYHFSINFMRKLCDVFARVLDGLCSSQDISILTVFRGLDNNLQVMVQDSSSKPKVHKLKKGAAQYDLKKELEKSSDIELNSLSGTSAGTVAPDNSLVIGLVAASGFVVVSALSVFAYRRFGSKDHEAPQQQQNDGVLTPTSGSDEFNF